MWLEEAASLGQNHAPALTLVGDEGKKNELDSRIKKTTLWGNYINIASAVWGAVGFILGVLTKDQLANLWEWLSAMF